jgi:hypothetical protein
VHNADIPPRGAQQPLHPVRRHRTGVLGQRAAVLDSNPATARGQRVDLSRVRRAARFGFPEGMPVPERRFAAAETMLGQGGVLGAQPWRWVDAPSVVADASYEPRQL